MLSRAHLISLMALELAAILLSAGFYFMLPDSVPVHWNIHGEVDRMGSKWELLAIMPAVGLGLIMLMAALPYVGPFRKNFEQFRVTYGRLLVVLVGGFTALHVVVLLSAYGAKLPIGPSIAVVLGIMMAIVGNWLGKIRRNFYIGIRTPWTIANNEVWERTHRVGGKLFVAWGVLMALSGLTGSNYIAFAVTIGGAVALGLWSVVYSLVLYRRLGEIDELGAG